jgi:integrase
LVPEINMQQGQVFRRHGSWYVRYYQDELHEGQPVRRRICERLAYYSDEYRSKKDVLPLVQDILYPVNSGSAQPESSLTLAEFIEKRYLPAREKKLRASTLKGYRDNFKFHVKESVGDIRMRDFHTKDGQHLFDAMAEETTPVLSHQTLLRVKAFLSAVFTYAKQEDVLRGANPMQGVKVAGRRYKPERIAYTLEDIYAMLAKLDEPAKTVVTVAAFTGLRASEIRGLRWDDYSGDEVRVVRSVWRTDVGPTKTEESGENPVPVIPILRRALDQHRKLHPGDGYVFAGERRGAPLHLDNLSRRVLTPKLKDAWKGWHGFRRGLGTNLYRLGVPPKVIQEILRHANVSTTETHYIVVDRSETKNAMKKLEKAVGNEWAKAKRRAAAKSEKTQQMAR